MNNFSSSVVKLIVLVGNANKRSSHAVNNILPPSSHFLTPVIRQSRLSCLNTAKKILLLRLQTIIEFSFRGKSFNRCS
jgi:hypothetical protein